MSFSLWWFGPAWFILPPFKGHFLLDNTAVAVGKLLDLATAYRLTSLADMEFTDEETIARKASVRVCQNGLLLILLLAATSGSGQGVLLNPNPGVGDQFGRGIAVLGADRVIIGASKDDLGIVNAGTAYLLSTNGNLLATFTNPRPTNGDNFGEAVAALGQNLVVVGASTENAGASFAGSAYLFNTNGMFVRTIENPSPAIGDGFGVSVAGLPPNRFLVGAFLDDTAANNAGAAYLFDTNGSLVTTYYSPNPKVEAGFGFSATTLGIDRVVLSAYTEDHNISTPSAGAVYLFSAEGTFLKRFAKPQPASGDWFGFSVAIVGEDKVVVGAINDDTGQLNTGAAYLFSTNGNLLTTITNPASGFGDQFGYSVSSVGPDKVLIGARYADTTGNNSGAAYLFDLSGKLLATLSNPSPAIGDEFGITVAGMGADWMFIGAWSDNAGQTDAGVVHLLAVPPPPSPILGYRRSSNALTLFWDSSAAGFLLENRTTFSSVLPAWNPVNEAYIVNGVEISVTVSMNDSKFFRLRRP